MSKSDTRPRFAAPLERIEREAGALIFAGRAEGPSEAGRPAVTFLSEDLELGRAPTRSPWSEIDDPFLSRRHARVGRGPSGTYWIRDLGSTNGTWVDGVRIPPEKQRRLRPGAVIMVGGHVFIFRHVNAETLEAIEAEAAAPFGPVPTRAPALALLLRKLRRLASSDVDLLLTGETGVGKEVHAEAVHRHSGRAGPFLAINCAAVPEALVESELYGYARGAHSTAERPKSGLLEQAEGGTLLLDEIGDMAPTAQTKLLRFLQSRQILPLGATQARSLDVRIVAASNRPLSGDFGLDGLRDDLSARLGPEPLCLPPLRERPEDMGTLLTALCPGPRPSFSPEAFLALFLHPWRGNVRELSKVLAVARVLVGEPGGEPEEEAIELCHLPSAMAARVDASPRAQPPRRERPTREQLVTLLERHGGDVARVAREIGRQRTLVWRWLRQHSVRVDDYRS
jgi:transcriptional regulator with PAS, ATPase and Fis domain